MEKRNGGMVDMIEKEIYLATEELLRLLNICNNNLLIEMVVEAIYYNDYEILNELRNTAYV